MFRILTENKNIDAIKQLLGRLGLDFTCYYGDGSWEGQLENSLLIELDRTSEDVAEEVARIIKQTNVQKIVLLQEIPVRSRYV